MTTYYDISLRVPVTKLATIIEVLNGEGKLLAVKESDEAAPARKPRAASSRTPHDEKGLDFLLRCLAPRPLSNEEMRAAFEANGRKGNSTSPLISYLTTSGEARRRPDGKLELVAGKGPA